MQATKISTGKGSQEQKAKLCRAGNVFLDPVLGSEVWRGSGAGGLCVQEVVRPDVFWYEAALKSPMPFGNSPAAILGLVAFELFAMHFVEVRRAYDFKNPGSQDQDPIFSNNKLPKHEVGYPGGIFAPVIPGVIPSTLPASLHQLKNACMCPIGPLSPHLRMNLLSLHCPECPYARVRSVSPCLFYPVLSKCSRSSWQVTVQWIAEALRQIDHDDGPFMTHLPGS